MLIININIHINMKKSYTYAWAFYAERFVYMLRRNLTGLVNKIPSPLAGELVSLAPLRK
jgi:hypothetical protein